MFNFPVKKGAALSLGALIAVVFAAVAPQPGTAAKSVLAGYRLLDQRHGLDRARASAHGGPIATLQSVTRGSTAVPPPDPVEAVWSAPTNPRVNVPVVLDGTRSTGNGALRCTWAFENETGTIVWQTREGCAIRFTFESTGAKYVRLSVRDANGDSASNKKSFLVAPDTTPPDTTPPDTSISSGPSGTTASTSASFAFSSTEPGSSFECKLDSGAFAACSSPKAYSGLGEGAHSFSVRATDTSGNTDPSPATQSWSVDASTPPPDPVEAVWSAPTNPRVNVPVVLDGTRSTGNGALRCTWAFENETGTIVWQTREGCAIRFTFESTGAKYVRLSVRDANGDSASNKKSFLVAPDTTPPDTTPPDTSISSGPSGTTASTSASFAFSSTEPGSSFECKLDSGAFAACSSPKAYSGLGEGAHSFSVRATDTAGNTDPSPASRSWSVEASSPPPSGSNCFPSPSTCGYPDPTNTGVPVGTTLTASGSITASTAGQVISGKDVTGQIFVNANNVTIENTRVTQTTTCGTTNTCGNFAIRVNSGISGTVIRNVETRTESGKTCEHDIRNQGSASVTGEGLYLHACDSNWYGYGTLKNSYGIAKIDISTDHVENVYFCSGTFTAEHDTLFNPVEQTAVIFGDTLCGGGNKYTVKDSLLAGGGYVFYPQANNSNPAGAQTVIEGNHIARCKPKEVSGPGGHWYCQGITNNSRHESPGDGIGYYPNGGSYNVGSYFSGPLTWSGNVWDDNLASVSAP